MTRLLSPGTPRPDAATQTGRRAGPPGADGARSAPLLGFGPSFAPPARVPCREALLCVLQADIQRYGRGVKPVHVGCSGWNYAEWRGLVYPEDLPQSRWLEHYATHFDTVEVNATFYRLPTRETVEHWIEQTPDGFQFAIKASRYLTHIKRLRELPKYCRAAARAARAAARHAEDGPDALAAAGELPPRRRATRRGAGRVPVDPQRDRVPASELVRARRCSSCCASTTSRW